MKKYIIIAALILLAPCTVSANNQWYSVEEQERIDAQFAQMQTQIDELNNLTAQLQTKVNQVSQQPVVEPQIQQIVETKVVETKEIVRDPDNTRVEALEARVSTLEKAVDYIQNQVMKAINTVISLLKKLL